MRWRGRIMLVWAVALIAAGCGGDDSGDVAEDVSETTVAEDATDSSSEDGASGEFDIASIEASTVKIAAEGSFVDPEVGLQLNIPGVGTGFIISEDGLAVTNNHVVTGAALLEVFVPGEEDPVNARILGVSECSDLAVIDLDGDGYTPLDFATEEPTTGLEVYAAGYPASDAATIDEVDYTLTSGIVSATTASGETNWASVDSVIEHDARIRGGNSGGPLVDEDGKVIAINYAGLDASDQNYAIAAADAMEVIEELREGRNVQSLGINGQAVVDEEAGISGVWVASVESGSPADGAGIEPGDIVTRLEGLVLATDGTMSDYCDILRTNGADATMAVEVLRFETSEVLEGQINGTPLEQSFSFAQELDDEVADSGSGDGGGGATATYAQYVTVSDDTGAITVDVPAEWSDIDGRPNESFGPSIYAAPDLQGFQESWDVPGIIVEASNQLTGADVEAVLSDIDLSGQCVDEGRSPYEDPLYVGATHLWSDCGGTGSLAIALAVSPPEGNFVIRMLIVAVDERDLDAADTALATFVAQL